MSAGICGTEFGVCAIRVTKVNPDGSVIAGNNAYVSDKMISVAVNVNKETGQTFSVRNGCGCSIMRFRSFDIFNWFEFVLVRAALEPELEAFMLGADVILDGAQAVGVNYPDGIDCDEAEPAVAFEFWTKQIEGSRQSASLPWVHHVYPYTTWSLGNNTFEEAAQQETMDGFSRENSLWGDGPYGDGPPDGTQVHVGDWWETDVEPPSAECNAVPVTATS
jgi:hypothetical protein